MKYFCIVFIIFMVFSCSDKCLECKVLKHGEMIESYESCDDKKVCRRVCEEMAKMQNAECECTAKAGIEKSHQ